MTSRRFVTTIGATALGFSVVIGNGAVAQPTFAQEAPARMERSAESDEPRAEAHNAFVTALASEQGADGDESTPQEAAS